MKRQLCEWRILGLASSTVSSGRACLSYINTIYLSLFIIYTVTDFEHFISYKYRFSMTGIRNYV